MKEKGARSKSTIDLIISDKIDSDITVNLKTLEVLTLLDNEDLQLLNEDGIDISQHIKNLQRAVDVQHPIIETSNENTKPFLKSIGNNGNADDVIRNMDLSQIERTGIPLQYSREAFRKRMNQLIAQYSKSDETAPNASMPIKKVEFSPLKLSEDGEIEALRAADEYKNNQNYTQIEEEIIVDGILYKGIRFKGSHPLGTGSNPGEFHLIEGKLYYIKEPLPENIGQSLEEVIASQLYRVAGIDAPNEHYVMDKDGNVIGMASEYIPGMKKITWDNTSESNVRLLFDSYAVDAWLANWDAPKNDNTVLFENGKRF